MRLLFIFFLGLASGLPLALSGTLLQAWLTVENINLMTIGWLSLIGLPYVFKFLWAPLFDRFQIGGIWRRSWIWTFEGLIIFLLILIACTPIHALNAIILLSLALAFCSASLDIVIDAYRTEFLKDSERGLGASFSVAGYRMAMLLSGGVALMLADLIGFSATYLCMAGCACHHYKACPPLFKKTMVLSTLSSLPIFSPVSHCIAVKTFGLLSV
jgi:MFS transporter, PAT family, beta-lactamase induction signal transducer AmpG